MWKAKKPLEFIIKSAYEVLDDIHETIGSVYEDISERQKQEGISEEEKAVNKRDLYYLADAFSKIEVYLDLMKGIDEEYKTEVLDELDAVKSLNSKLNGRIAVLEEENNLLRERLNAVFDENATLLKEINEHMRVFNSRVDEAVGQIACKEFISSEEYKHRDRKGAKAPRFRRDVKDEDIVKQYQSGVSIRELAENYNMTENGMRLRLKELGVWEDRRFSANKKIGSQ